MRKLNAMPSWLVPAVLAVLVIAAVAVALIIGESKPKTSTQNNQTATSCGPYRQDVVIHINNHAFNTEIAKTDAEKVKGLAGRPCILPNQAMLFPYTQEGHYAYWMKDMKFPIDVIWITAKHKVAAIEVDFKPSSYPEKRVNQIPAQYVMEVKANRTKELHIDIGTTVTF